MINLTREEAQQLLDGFERVGWAKTEHADILRARISAPERNCTRSHPHENMDAMCELRTEIARLTNENARLSAPEPSASVEPVAKFVLADGLNKRVKLLVDDLPIGTLFYTAPPQREWQGLTDEEIIRATVLIDNKQSGWVLDLSRAIEAKLKEKNA